MYLEEIQDAHLFGIDIEINPVSPDVADGEDTYNFAFFNVEWRRVPGSKFMAALRRAIQRMEDDVQYGPLIKAARKNPKYAYLFEK